MNVAAERRRQPAPARGTAKLKYGYDNIRLRPCLPIATAGRVGNRTSSKSGGTAATPSVYTANELNQYEERTVPGAIWVLGSANTGATVTANNSGVTRQGAYYSKELTVTNTSAAAYQSLSVVGVRKNAGPGGTDVVTTVTGNVFVPKTPEAYTYDDDGNLTQDGRFTYAWDGENRLLLCQPVVTNGNTVKVEFSYDYMGRRVMKVVSNWTNSQWTVVSSNQFLYDGWNLVQEISDTPTPPYSVTNSYVYGLDLSGSLQGAGGIGGLISWTRSSDTNSCLYTFDANGNVGQLLTASTPTNIAAHYEYDAYGNTVVATGTEADNNVFRFSTKYLDVETLLYYYGYRYYKPEIGRWLSRDPLYEIAHRVAYENEDFGRFSNTALSGGARPTVLKYQVILHSLDLVEILADDWGHRPDTRFFPNAKAASLMLADEYRRKHVLRTIPEQDVAESQNPTPNIGRKGCRNRGTSVGADRHPAFGNWHLLPGKGLQRSIGRSSTPADSAAEPRKHLPRPPQMRGGHEYQAFNANSISHVDVLGLQALCDWNCFGTQRMQCDDKGCGNQNGQYALGCNLDCNCSGTMTITIP